VEKAVSSNEGISSPSEEIEPSAPGNQESKLITKTVIGPFKDIPPAGAFMDLIKDDPGITDS
jgi:hypothetical protein